MAAAAGAASAAAADEAVVDVESASAATTDAAPGAGGASGPLPTFFISHGGGPSFVLDSSEMGGGGALAALSKDSPTADWLRGFVARELGGRRPKAVVVISAHWETRGGHQVQRAGATATATATDADAAGEKGAAEGGGEGNGLLFDYGGFPQKTYELRWPARTGTALHERVLGLLERAGEVPVSAAPATRGYDHGVFIPLMLMFPEPSPEMPVLQVSLDSGLDAAQHLRLGAALRPLRDEGVLVVGSGFLTHNLRASFATPLGAEPPAWFTSFVGWVHSTIAGGDASANKERADALRDWATAAPGGRDAHPREEHLLPLHVAAAAASGDASAVGPGKVVFEDRAGALCSSMLRWD